MSVDYTKFPFPYVDNPRAANLTEAIRVDPVSAGFVVLTLKVGERIDFADTVRAFAETLRAGAQISGLTDITAYREVRSDEWGGAVPFDQAICDVILEDAKKRNTTEAERFPGAKFLLKMIQGNDMADWVLLLEYGTTDQALAAARISNKGQEGFAALTKNTKSHTVSAFKNTMGYAKVLRDPNLVQFFNLFPGPGDPEKLWPWWQRALPWLFESGELRSSFPLVSLDASQPLLIVNYAHCDSVKHFLLGVAYNPNFIETITGDYAGQGFKLPLPFFCKIVPV